VEKTEKKGKEKLFSEKETKITKTDDM